MSHFADTHSSSGITCLHCGKVTLPPNRKSFEAWHCSNCFSGILSLTMITNLASHELVDQITLSSRLTTETGRGCPLCQQPMKIASAVFNQKNLRLETCRHCRLVWFDSGEVMRTLRHRPEEVFVSQGDTVTVSRNGTPPRVLEEPVPEGSVPWLTFALLGTWAAAGTLSVHFPVVLARFGFAPAEPFRLFGATWITSLFLHENANSVLWTLPLMLFFGTVVERRMGQANLMKVFLVSGIAGRFVEYFFAPSSDTIWVGATYALCGVGAAALTIFPYRHLLFPDESWRSPTSHLIILLVGVTCCAVILLGLDFFWVAISQVAQGKATLDYSQTHWAAIWNGIGTAIFYSYVTAFAAGVWICLGFLGQTPRGRRTVRRVKRTRSYSFRRATFR